MLLRPSFTLVLTESYSLHVHPLSQSSTSPIIHFSNYPHLNLPPSRLHPLNHSSLHLINRLGHQPTFHLSYSAIRSSLHRRNGLRLGRRPINRCILKLEADIDARPARVPPRAVAAVQGLTRPPKVERHEPPGLGRGEAEVRAVAPETVRLRVHAGRVGKVGKARCSGFTFSVLCSNGRLVSYWSSLSISHSSLLYARIQALHSFSLKRTAAALIAKAGSDLTEAVLK